MCDPCRAILATVGTAARPDIAPYHLLYWTPAPRGHTNILTPSRSQSSLSRGDEVDESHITQLSKSDVILSFQIEVGLLAATLYTNCQVVVLEVRNLKSVQPTSIIYSTMQVDNHDKLATDQVQLSPVPPPSPVLLFSCSCFYSYSYFHSHT